MARSVGLVLITPRRPSPSQLESLPAATIVPVHGTLSRAACEGCGAEMPIGEFCDKVRASVKDIYATDTAAPAESSNILCGKCGKPTVKPTTVLFGGSLPEAFFSCSEADLPSLDLLIVAGTSLAVAPANSLVYRAPDSTVRPPPHYHRMAHGLARVADATCGAVVQVRVVVNRERVGEDLGIDYGGRDVLLEGDCDEARRV